QPHHQEQQYSHLLPHHQQPRHPKQQRPHLHPHQEQLYYQQL
ncbi:unnamed protein product, partial [Rotaria sp. Silwood2]